MKSKKIILIISGIIILLSALIFLLLKFNVLNSVISAGIGNNYEYENVVMTANTPQYVEYSIDFIYSGSNPNECTSVQTLNLNFNVNDKPYSDAKRILFPSDFSSSLYQIPQNAKTTNVQLTNIANQISNKGCGDTRYIGVAVPFTQDNSASCTLSETPSVIAGNNQAPSVVINCNVKAVLQANQPTRWYGDLSGNIKVKFLKQGTECLDDSYCSSGETCTNYKCIVPETAQTYYQFSNNECSLVSIFPSTKTSNDYSSLSECENNIVQTSTQITVYRLENNICNSYTIDETNKLSSDYSTLSKCEKNIVVDSGTGTDTGTDVGIIPKQINTKLITWIAGIVFFVLLIVVIFMVVRRKKTR